MTGNAGSATERSIGETLTIGHLILTIAALGFLGLGIQPPTSEWGIMSVAPHLLLVPGVTLFR